MNHIEPLNHIEPVVSQQEPSVILLGHIDEIQKQEPKTQITIIQYFKTIHLWESCGTTQDQIYYSHMFRPGI